MKRLLRVKCQPRTHFVVVELDRYTLRILFILESLLKTDSEINAVMPLLAAAVLKALLPRVYLAKLSLFVCCFLFDLFFIIFIFSTSFCISCARNEKAGGLFRDALRVDVIGERSEHREPPFSHHHHFNPRLMIIS